MEWISYFLDNYVKFNRSLPNFVNNVNLNVINVYVWRFVDASVCWFAESSFKRPFPTCRSIGYTHCWTFDTRACSSNGICSSLTNALQGIRSSMRFSRISRRMRLVIDRFAPGRACFEIRMPFKGSLYISHTFLWHYNYETMVRSFSYTLCNSESFRIYIYKICAVVWQNEWALTRQHGGGFGSIMKMPRAESVLIFFQ